MRITNLFPTMESVKSFENPVYIVKFLTITAVDRAKFSLFYIQDLHTGQVIYYKEFDLKVKAFEAISAISHFFELVKPINYKDIALIPLAHFLKKGIKLILFSSATFRSYLTIYEIKASFYSRRERLDLFHAQKLLIKHQCIYKSVDWVTGRIPKHLRQEL